MNEDWSPVEPDSVRRITFHLHKTATPAEVFAGTATGALELTRFVSRASQSNFECTATLNWHTELYGADQPGIGQVLEVRLDGQQLFVGIIAAIQDYQLRPGTKEMQVLARSRDALPVWRDTRRVTDIFPVATPLGHICRQIASTLGLTPAEVDIPDGVVYTVHSNTQLADLTPWQMLETLLVGSGLAPYVDARGKLKTISRDTQRPADIVYDDNRRLISVQGSKARSPVTEVRVKWLDPNLTEVAQQAQVLGQATITAGFFQLHQRKDISFSADGRQRARGTYLVTKQTANSGLLHVCSEEWQQLSQTSGRITLTTTAWVPTLATAAIVAKYVAHNTPDYVPAVPGPTVPAGRRVEFAADVVLLLTMMSVGTGVYEIWGTPFDYVHARNTTVAYSDSAKPWDLHAVEIETDFVMNEAQAQALAVRELLYAHRSASQWGLKIVDDPRIENGDIIQLQDGTRIYVTGYRRDLSPGAPAVLEIQGFQAPYEGANVGPSETIPLPPPTPSPTPYPPPPPEPGPTDPPPEPEFPVPIYIEAVPFFNAKKWRLKFYKTGVTIPNPLPINIDNWDIGAYAEPNGAQNGTAESDGLYERQHPNYAFGNAGVWSNFPTGPESDSHYSLLGFTFDSIERSDSAAHKIRVAAPANGPRNFDVEFFNEFTGLWEVSQVVRDEPAWSASNLERTYKARKFGTNFWRLNIDKSYGEFAVPSGPVWLTRITSLEMYTILNGTDVCPSAGGRGNCDSAYASTTGARAFDGDLTTYVTMREAIGGDRVSTLRYEFPASTHIVEYGIRVPSSGSAPYSWTFETSPDGVRWTVVDTQTAVYFADGELKRFALQKPVIAVGDVPGGSPSHTYDTPLTLPAEFTVKLVDGWRDLPFDEVFADSFSPIVNVAGHSTVTVTCTSKTPSDANNLAVLAWGGTYDQTTFDTTGSIALGTFGQGPAGTAQTLTTQGVGTLYVWLASSAMDTYPPGMDIEMTVRIEAA